MADTPGRWTVGGWGNRTDWDARGPVAGFSQEHASVRSSGRLATVRRYSPARRCLEDRLCELHSSNAETRGAGMATSGTWDKCQPEASRSESWGWAAPTAAVGEGDTREGGDPTECAER